MRRYRSDNVDDWQDDEWDTPEVLYDFEGEALRGDRGVLRVVGFTALSLLVVAVLIAGAVGLWVVNQVNPTGAAGERINFTVDADDDLMSVSNRLETQGVISSAKVFRWYVNQKGSFELTPGYFSVRPKDDMGQVMQALSTLPEQTFEKVTFPEGFTVDQFGKRLASKLPRLSSARFAALAASGEVRSAFQPEGQPSLEGLIFPDTYQVSGNEDERKVLEKLVKQMERIGVGVGLDKAVEKVGYSPYEVLVVASLIEREAKFDEDRPKIAQVIYNRLGAQPQIPLQIDASLFYAQDPTLTFGQIKDLDTPYNTYKYRGLPPTPIASPGAAAIRAALNPSPPPPLSECPDQKVSCGYLYYVLKDKEGHHVFATSYAQHLVNVQAAQDAGVLG